VLTMNGNGSGVDPPSARPGAAAAQKRTTTQSIRRPRRRDTHRSVNELLHRVNGGGGASRVIPEHWLTAVTLRLKTPLVGDVRPSSIDDIGDRELTQTVEECGHA
jgi:hypothetical protein